MLTVRTLRALLAEMISTSPRQAAASVVLLLGLSLSEGAGLVLLLPLLELVGVVEGNPLPRAAGWMAHGFSVIGVEPTLGSVLLLFVAVAGVRSLLQRWQARLTATVRENVTAAVRIRVYRAIAAAQWKFLVTRKKSEFVHVLAGEIGRVGMALQHVIDLTVAAAVSLVYMALALRLSPSMAVLVMLCGCTLAWALRGRLGQARAFGTRESAARKNLQAAISEHFSSMKTAKSYGAAERHADIFAGLSRKLRHVNLQVAVGETDLQQSLEIGSTVLMAVIVYVSFQILEVPTAQLLVLLFVFARLMPRLVSMYRRAQMLQNLLPAFESVIALERECRAAAEPPATSTRDIALERSIRLEDVSFTYLRRTDTPALQHVSLEIDAGRTTAIVGRSGAGKSTIADLLIGLLSPTSGRILVDREVLSADVLEGWRRHIGYVPQDTFLFHDTVRANLKWARPDASDEEVWHALWLAAADEFVMALPQGLDTVVGERGTMVSGGERQRLSLARALLRRPYVLVLDEATSSLDAETERRIQQSIESLHSDMTIVIVTHRLSMISGADFIHVIEDGRLVESGTWDALLARPNGRFADLCRAQGIYRRPVPVALESRPRLKSVNE